MKLFLLVINYFPCDAASVRHSCCCSFWSVSDTVYTATSKLSCKVFITFFEKDSSSIVWHRLVSCSYRGRQYIVLYLLAAPNRLQSPGTWLRLIFAFDDVTLTLRVLVFHRPPASVQLDNRCALTSLMRLLFPGR